jgi:mono/diheme cytochrome c family protein
MRHPRPLHLIALLFVQASLAFAVPDPPPDLLPARPVFSSLETSQAEGDNRLRSGRELYLDACAACHGGDGTGAPPSQVGFDVPLPDFTDCDFAAREPNGDWLAVAHTGGPARGFAREMPAFGEALTDDEILRITEYVRGFCTDDAWPRGELNLPRPLVTSKAYVEDEAVLSTSVDAENWGAVMNEVVYEQRVGARSQYEIVVPFGFREQDEGGWTGGQLGDVALSVKRAMYHSVERGTILSVAAEAILPTGDEAAGFGSGTVVFEPYVAFGQLLPANAFFQFQGAVGLPLDRDKANEEAVWRSVLGTSFSQGRWGRTWSPMVEVLGSRELISDAPTHWDVVPQVQVTLNTRQNIMANVGARIPVDGSDRNVQVMGYLLWDWFDGGLLDGW